MSRRRIVAIEFGTWRSGRSGGAFGSITVGYVNAGTKVQRVAFLRSSLMHFYCGHPLPFCSGVDIQGYGRVGPASGEYGGH